MNFELSDLRIFHALCQTRNISAAASEVHLTTSAVSLRLKKLEEAAGARLFLRESQGLVITPAGKAFQEGSVPVLAQAAALASRMGDFSEKKQEPLRINANSAGLQNVLCPLVSRFIHGNPTFRCVFRECRSLEALDAVVVGEADLALIGNIPAGTPSAKNALFMPFHKDRHVLITPPEHELADRRRVAFSETLRFRSAALLESQPISKAMEERARAAGMRFEPVIRVPFFGNLVDLVREGGLVAVLPFSALREFSGLHVVELEDAWAVRQLSFVLPAERPAAADALRFVQFARSAEGRALFESSFPSSSL